MGDQLQRIEKNLRIIESHFNQMKFNDDTLRMLDDLVDEINKLDGRFNDGNLFCLALFQNDDKILSLNA